MGQCLERMKHEDCGGGGLQVFAKEDGTVDGYCFSCSTYVRHPYGEEKKAEDIPKPEKKSEEEVQKELAEISTYQTLKLPSRKLRQTSLEKYGVKVAVSTQDGQTPVAAYYPYTKDGKVTGYKAKTLVGPKQVWSIGSLAGVDPFGWEQAIRMGARRVIIVEGEEDAVALSQIIDKHTPSKYQDYKSAVISLQHGVSTVKNTFPKFIPKLKRHFQEFMLCFDDDIPGKQATEDAHRALPEATTAMLPFKDANQCIMEGATKAAFDAVQFKSSNVKNTRLVSADELFEEAAEPAQFGELTWPWHTLNDITRGIRYGETYYIGAGAKMGKSEVVDTLIAHFITEHGIKVFAIKPEQANKLTIKKVASKIVGKIFHDPKIEFDKESYDKATGIMAGKLTLLNLYQHVGWATLKDDIRAAALDGNKVVIIDPITNLTNGVDPSTANTMLQEIAQELSSMALDLNIAIFIFCHLKSPEGNLSMEARERKYAKNQFIGLGGCPHEFGGDVISAQFAGSRAMMR